MASISKASEVTSVHVTQRYLVTCLWNVNFVVEFFKREVVLQITNVHVTQAYLSYLTLTISLIYNVRNVNFVARLSETELAGKPIYVDVAQIHLQLFW